MISFFKCEQKGPSYVLMLPSVIPTTGGKPEQPPWLFGLIAGQRHTHTETAHTTGLEMDPKQQRSRDKAQCPGN